MTSIVVCFSGRIGSGKTSVSHRVADGLNATWTGFGDVVRALATARGLDSESRAVLQDLGEQLINEHGVGWLCNQVIRRSAWNGDRPLVIDGVRHVEVLDEIARCLAPHSTLLIHLDYDDNGERARILDVATRSAVEQHSTERDVLNALPARADFVVATHRPLEEVVESILTFVRSVTGARC